MDASFDPLKNHEKYETIKHLGQGEEVAVKVIGLGERFYNKYVEREIMNHRQLLHPHIVSFKEVFVTPEYLGIAMEYIGGGNLQQWVEKYHRLPEWQARCFFQQITLALCYIHKALGIAHRDIKLGNILLNDRYQIPVLKLCDFGYSKSSWLGSIPKTRVGTAAYISPEVARASTNTGGYDTEKADVWSTGVTLYCMLAGKYPFSNPGGDVHLKRIKELTDADVAEALTRISSVTPSVSPGCTALIQRMLIIDPVARISLEGIMADEWFKEYLPDISKLAKRAEKKVQPEDQVRAVLVEAERLSALKRAGVKDDFDDEDLDQGLDELLDELDEDSAAFLEEGGGGGGHQGAGSLDDMQPYKIRKL